VVGEGGQGGHRFLPPQESRKGGPRDKGKRGISSTGRKGGTVSTGKKNQNHYCLNDILELGAREGMVTGSGGRGEKQMKKGARTVGGEVSSFKKRMDRKIVFSRRHAEGIPSQGKRHLERRWLDTEPIYVTIG